MVPRSTRNVRYEGVLRRGEVSVPVQVAYASRFSLYASIVGPSTIPYNQEFDQVVLRVPKGEATFGHCVFYPVSDGEGFTGRLVFSDDAYNFGAFFSEESLTSLESRGHKLQLVLQQQKSIKPEFRAWCAELLYEMNAYKAFFDGLDVELEGEPDDVRALAQNTILLHEESRFVEFFDRSLASLEALVQDYSHDEHAAHGFYFRKQFWHCIKASDFLARTNIKPRGYAGDSEMMRMIYACAYESPTLFGKLLHKHAIMTPAAQAVRNRRRLIADIIRQNRDDARLRGDERSRCMSVACGPAYEIGDIYQSPQDLTSFEVTLLDQDVEALSEASGNIKRAETRHGGPAHVTYLNESVRTMLRAPQVMETWGKFDFVYSMGLFDYLTEPVARAVAKRLFELLKPGGTLLIGNYHLSNPTQTYMEYWMDWVLCYRSEEDFLALINDNPAADVSVGFEGSGSQMFLKVRRRDG